MADTVRENSQAVLGQLKAAGINSTVMLTGGEEFPLHAAWREPGALRIDGELARIFNLPQPRGVLVENVAAGSPASVLGLQPGKYIAVIGDQQLVVGGDIILKVDGTETKDLQDAVKPWCSLERYSA